MNADTAGETTMPGEGRTAKERRLAGWILTLFGVAIPIVLLALLIHRYWVNVPLLDDWEMAPLIVQAHNGTLSLRDLFTQHAEARNVFPKLFFVTAAMGSTWDVRVEMVTALVICCATLALLYVLLRRAGFSLTAAGVALFLMALLIFSPAQHELWLLASGFYSFVPVLCIVAGLVVVGSRSPIWLKFVLCAILAFLSSFTLAHGLLAWALTFPILFFQRRVPRAGVWIGAWIAATAACVAIYFLGYRKQTDLPPFAPSVSLADYAGYLLGFLGAPFGRAGTGAPLMLSQIIGGVLLVLFLALLVYLLVRRRRNDEVIADGAPFVALGFYAIASGCLAALGRVGWGVAQSLESRYVAFALYLAVALIALVWIVVRDLQARRSDHRGRSVWIWAAGLVAAVLLAFHIVCAVASVPAFRHRAAATRLGQAGMLFSPVIDTSKTIRDFLFPRPDFVQIQAALLDSLKLLKPPLVRTTDVRSLRTGRADDKNVSGWFDGATAAGADNYTAWGWAAILTKGRSADAVLLAHDGGSGEWTIFAVSDVIESRKDIAKLLGNADFEFAGWRATFPRSAVPPGAKISAWAFDTRDMKLFRLKENPAGIGVP